MLSLGAILSQSRAWGTGINRVKYRGKKQARWPLLRAAGILVTQKEDTPFTRNEGWREWVADEQTMGLGPRF